MFITWVRRAFKKFSASPRFRICRTLYTFVWAPHLCKKTKTEIWISFSSFIRSSCVLTSKIFLSGSSFLEPFERPSYTRQLGSRGVVQTKVDSFKNKGRLFVKMFFIQLFQPFLYLFWFQLRSRRTEVRRMIQKSDNHWDHFA